MSIPPSIGSPTILPFLSTSIVVGNAIISEAYLPAFEEESIERLRYFAPWLSFEPFFRVDKSRSRELGGVGLGLCYCINTTYSYVSGRKVVNKPVG